ncbi:hypothetical protein [Nocardia transvalensis]|uniref:hypothetical protein n=1 Tax=Nocardia transvalensis TaxID=37333 RepID=UPI0018951FFD|nr:hypothetical protein [Nocardia transvalensis]MBF6328759.1 hypothetical protein [Nocardia transvalensis]
MGMHPILSENHAHAADLTVAAGLARLEEDLRWAGQAEFADRVQAILARLGYAAVAVTR